MDNQEDYRSLNHKYWCDLLSTIEVKDIRKRAATQIKKIAYARTASHSNSSGYVRITRNNKASTGFLHKNPNKKASNHHGTRHHLMLSKKAGMPEKKYMSNSSEDCFGKRSDQKSIIDRLGGPMGSRSEVVKQYKRS